VDKKAVAVQHFQFFKRLDSVHRFLVKPLAKVGYKRPLVFYRAFMLNLYPVAPLKIIRRTFVSKTVFKECPDRQGRQNLTIELLREMVVDGTHPGKKALVAGQRVQILAAKIGSFLECIR